MLDQPGPWSNKSDYPPLSLVETICLHFGGNRSGHDNDGTLQLLKLFCGPASGNLPKLTENTCTRNFPEKCHNSSFISLMQILRLPSQIIDAGATARHVTGRSLKPNAYWDLPI